jgi:sec-independent protein translocase protein TatA
MGLDNPLHIALLALIVLLIFGARRLPEIGRSLGTGMREFKDSVTGADKQQALPPAQPVQPVVEPVQAAASVPPAPAAEAAPTPGAETTV